MTSSSSAATASSRRLIVRSRELIDRSRERTELVRAAVRSTSWRQLPRRAGGSDLSNAKKAPACNHRYVTLELGQHRDRAIEEAAAARRDMVSAPYRRDGEAWTVALCRECADSAAP